MISDFSLTCAPILGNDKLSMVIVSKTNSIVQVLGAKCFATEKVIDIWVSKNYRTKLIQSENDKTDFGIYFLHCFYFT